MIRQEYADELYSAISHNTGDDQDPSSALPTTLADNTDHGDHHDGVDATGESARHPFAAAEHKEGGDYQYTQEEWDQYNAEHGGQHDAPSIAPPSFADEAPANSSTGTIHSHQASPQTLPTLGTTPGDRQQLEQYDEHNIGHSDASLNGIDGGEGHGTVQEGASDDAVPSKLDGEKMPPSAVAADVAATKEGYHADDIDDIERQKQQQQQLKREGEESDDLYDIDDHGLSSSDDD